MIKVTIFLDGKEVDSATAASQWVLPDVVAKLGQPWEHDPNVVWQREEKIKDASGQLTELRVYYSRKLAKV